MFQPYLDYTNGSVFSANRWQGVRRDYLPGDVERLRGSVRVRHTLAERGAERLWDLLNDEDYVHALGAVGGSGFRLHSDIPPARSAARSGSAEQYVVWRSLVCEKRSAEWAWRSGSWQGMGGVSRPCPDKAPSCYPDAGLHVSKGINCDIHCWVSGPPGTGCVSE